MTDHTSAVERLVGQWRHDAQGCGRKDAHAADTWRSCARQLAAAIKQDSEAGAVAFGHVYRVLGNRPESSEWTQPGIVFELGPAVSARLGPIQCINLYTRPASALPEVTDAMVERAMAGLIACRGTYENEVPVTGDEVRAALTAALRPETQG